MKRILFLLFALQTMNVGAQIQPEGPLNPSTATYSVYGCLACPGGEWNNLQNITNADHQYVDVLLASYPSCFQATCYYSRILYAYDFGFSIPQTAVITGVSASVLRMSTAATGMSDSSIQLYTGEPVGTNHANLTFWTPNPMTVTYGDSLDLWGYPLTPDTVNNSQFGLAVLVMNKNFSAAFSTASVDQIQMTVFYNTGTGIQSQTRNSGMFSVHYNSSSTTLDVLVRAGKVSSMLITDNLGNEIYHSNQSLESIQNKLTIPELKKGIYFVTAYINGKPVTEKFTVQ